jgi:hypothetical protein
MRPLVVFTGQGVPRADGLNLTRRMKATPRLAALTSDVRRKDRQNLDALLEACAVGGDEAIDEVLHDLRAICLKERRSTMRKTVHRDFFEVLAEAATSRLVAHLTTNLDGLTTTFAVRDFAACWPPFHGPAHLDVVRRDFQQLLDRGSGLLHVPLHGEAGLMIAEPGGAVLQTAYGAPKMLRGDVESWLPSLRLGAAAGMAGIEARLITARLGYTLLDALLCANGAADASADLDVPEHAAADLVVAGYGAEDGRMRETYPFEHRITRLVATGRRDPGARWTALVYRPHENAPTAEWFAKRDFAVLPYDDGELPRVLRQALTRCLPGARYTPGTEPRGLRCDRHDAPTS